MQVAKCIANTVAVAALACGMALTANAQIGSGWTSTSVSFTTQISSGCSITNTSNFRVGSGTSGRAERRYDTNTNTQRQFQGDVKVDSLGGDRINIKQTFDQDNGPYQLVAVSKANSDLYETEGGNELASYTVGNTVTINTIITRSSGSVAVYINGSLAETKTGGSEDLYDKCGAYISSSGSGPAETTWNSVQFWKK
jgi:hypothetical protein